MKINVPFYGQSWDLDSWQLLGYESREEAEYWQRSCCGILCAKMAMNAVKKDAVTHSIKELIDLGVKRGAYQDGAGWSHEGLTQLIRGFGFGAKRGSFSVSDLRDQLESGSPVIISIKWAFENSKTVKERILFWKKYGGHLAVVVGFEQAKEGIAGFYVHHTSKIPKQNWEARFVPLERFSAGYVGRGIAVMA